jgi:hypothetical protein
VRWHLLIGGQKTLTFCHDRSEDILIFIYGITSIQSLQKGGVFCPLMRGCQISLEQQNKMRCKALNFYSLTANQPHVSAIPCHKRHCLSPSATWGGRRATPWPRGGSPATPRSCLGWLASCPLAMGWRHRCCWGVVGEPSHGQGAAR